MQKSDVYFIKIDEINKLKNILPEFTGKTAVKVHFGERGCETFVSADKIKIITDMINDAIFIETSVLYKSARRTAVGHQEIAIEHGFNYLPIDFLDGDKGDNSIEIQINGKHFQECYLGNRLENYKNLLVLSHFKGHGGCGFGGAMKNLGMGLASRKGKLAMHASIKHRINKDKCISCGNCISHCPVTAIAFNSAKKAYIKEQKCISCSKCISVCPSGAVRIPWGSTGKQELGERISEYAYAAQKDKNCFYINFLINITSDCDCCDIKMPKMIEDIGVLASIDPIAVDKASYDMVVKQLNSFKDDYKENIFNHSESLGLGTKEYNLINL